VAKEYHDAIHKQQRLLQTLFGDKAVTDVRRFIDNTEVGKKPAAETNNNDSWDIERLVRSTDGGDVTLEDGGG
jgi:hypothetical protein